MIEGQWTDFSNRRIDVETMSEAEFNIRAQFLKFRLRLQMPRLFGFRFRVSVMKNDEFYQN